MQNYLPTLGHGLGEEREESTQEEGAADAFALLILLRSRGL